MLFDWCSFPHNRKGNKSNYSLYETELLFDLLGMCHLVIFLVWSILASSAKGRQLKDTAGPTGSRETLGTKPGLQNWEKTPQSERAKSDLAEKATRSMEHSQASVSASVENVRAFVQNTTSRGQLMNNTVTTLSPPLNPMPSLQIPSLDAAGKPMQAKTTLTTHVSITCGKRGPAALLSLCSPECLVAEKAMQSLASRWPWRWFCPLCKGVHQLWIWSSSSCGSCTAAKASLWLLDHLPLPLLQDRHWSAL